MYVLTGNVDWEDERALTHSHTHAHKHKHNKYIVKHNEDTREYTHLQLTDSKSSCCVRSIILDRDYSCCLSCSSKS